MLLSSLLSRSGLFAIRFFLEYENITAVLLASIALVWLSVRQYIALRLKTGWSEYLNVHE